MFLEIEKYENVLNRYETIESPPHRSTIAGNVQMKINFLQFFTIFFAPYTRTLLTTTNRILFFAFTQFSHFSFIPEFNFIRTSNNFVFCFGWNILFFISHTFWFYPRPHAYPRIVSKLWNMYSSFSHIYRRAGKKCWKKNHRIKG